MTARDEMERVVSETHEQHFVMWHELVGEGQPPGEWRCSCGLKFGFSGTAIKHVAAETAAALAPLLPEATVREEWGVRTTVGSLAGYVSRTDGCCDDVDWHNERSARREAAEEGGEVVRRTVTTYAPKVGEWEAVES